MRRPGPTFGMNRKRPKGLTLIELMVTISLLGIGLIGVASMFVYGYRTQLQAHFASVATDIAAKKLERVRAVGFNGISTENFPPTFAVAELPSGSGTLSFEPYPNASAANQYLVTVVIEWGGGPGVAGNVTLVSLVSNHS
ncbi:MAG: type IV pilus modification PilV family protein [Candidatus Zipacnadales bacterium]